MDRIINKNVALGIDLNAEFTQMTIPWEKDDCLLISSFAVGLMEESAQDFFEKIVQENVAAQTPQKFVDSILRKVKLTLSKTSQQRTLSLIGISKKL